ncbi:MAG: hypothetical protein WC942_10515 [Clostridia bacterium]|jgi:hypothetical protein
MDWIISITSCIMLYFMGNKSIIGPILGIINQGLWIFYVSYTQQWGLLLGVSLYTVIHVRNLLKWVKEGVK